MHSKVDVSMPKNQFVPDNFDILFKLETENFRLRMLSVNDVEKDYEAVMESQDLLHRMFGGPWSKQGFTLEENLDDLKRHQQEFLDRNAFAYTVISLDESKVLGCVYINPSEVTNLDAIVHTWVRQSEYDKGLDNILFNTVKDWISVHWPFKTVDYPSRL